MWRSGEIDRVVDAALAAGWVTMPGYIDDGSLRDLYSSAAVVAYISLYEGFGLPVIEAMACGAIVVASSTTAIPEAAGPAAVLVDPTDTEAIHDGLRRALQDEALRRALTSAGQSRASEFTRARMANATVAAYAAALASSGTHRRASTSDHRLR
jgi:alpha-1,3-rhamnosyl/mannosyltransferase